MRKLITFDWALKRILRDKANFDILEGFLSELLQDDIKILEILESESNKEDPTDKTNRLDIKVRDKKNELILIEIQYSTELDFMQRVLYASSRAIIEHMRQGFTYAKINKVISISILYFDFGDGDDYVYKGTTSFMGIHSKTPLRLSSVQKNLYKTRNIEDIYPEYYLIKVKNFPDTLNDPLDEWLNFLKNEEIPENVKARGLKEAKEKLEYFKMDEQERRQYEWYQENRHYEASMYESTFTLGEIEGEIRGVKKGREEGIKEGEKNKALYIAKNMRNANIPLELIIKTTGLTEKEIQEL